MNRENNLGKYFHTRREFMKISGLSAGSLALGSLIKAPVGFAKEKYPGHKILLSCLMPSVADTMS